MKALDFTYLTQPPKRYTFEMPKLKKWVESWCEGEVLNLFAGKTLLRASEYRVDIDQDMPADWHGDAYDFVTTTDMKFDTIILDPPYNLRKAREKYEGRHIGSLTKIKNELDGVIRPNGLILSLGYDSTGMGKKRGYRKIAICLICHAGDHNDTIALVERRMERLS